jgi:hypothetical protein
MFKEYTRNVGKLTPEQSAQFKKEADERVCKRVSLRIFSFSFSFLVFFRL